MSPTLEHCHTLLKPYFSYIPCVCECVNAFILQYSACMYECTYNMYVCAPHLDLVSKEYQKSKVLIKRRNHSALE